MPLPAVIHLTDSSHIGECRRVAQRIAESAQFSDVDCGRVGIIATELGTNLLRHAGQGRMIVQTIESTARTQLEILAIDHGPGIADVGLALRDGFSTGGTSGNGLGAIRRLSDQFDVYSQISRGTIVLSRINGPVKSEDCTEISVWCGISIPAPREFVCGDGWQIHDYEGRFSLMVVDGLGHGPEAARVAEMAMESFHSHRDKSVLTIFEETQRTLSGTRGAAMGLAVFVAGSSALQFVGIGNIAGIIRTSEQSRGLCSQNGILGVQIRKVQQMEYPCDSDFLLIMHSDGLQSRWNLDDYPGLINCHPSIIAAMLYRDFVRGKDDVTVVVARLRSKMTS